MAVAGGTPITFSSHYCTIVGRLLERRLVMKMTEVQKKAKELGIKTESLKKADLIRKIQTEEGNRP
jgi:hypothetical protein